MILYLIRLNIETDYGTKNNPSLDVVTLQSVWDKQLGMKG